MGNLSVSCWRGAVCIRVLLGAESAVDVGSSVLYAEKRREKSGEGIVDLVVRPGEEYVFWWDLKLDEDEWRRKSLEKVTELWLGEDDG